MHQNNVISGKRDGRPENIGRSTTDSCPFCGGPVVHAEGCFRCVACGYGMCD